MLYFLPRSRRSVAGFTLMELLVVVAILALVGGLVVVAYEGLVSQSAKGASAHTISSLGNAVRSFQVMERGLPDDLDSLVAVNVGTAMVTYNATLGDNVGTAYNATHEAVASSILSPLLLSRLQVIRLTQFQKNNLLAAGIDSIRYLDVRGEGNGGILNIRGINNATATVGPIRLIDIPQHVFDVPLPGSANRGRGFSFNLRGSTAGFLPHVARWLPGPGGYENVKLGTAPGATLIVLGVGKNCTLISAKGAITGVTTTSARLDAPPFYGDVAKSEYPSYLLVIDVDRTPAKFITVVDPTGSFLAENYAGGRGQ